MGNINLDAERERLGIKEELLGTKLREVETGDIWTIQQRGGYAARFDSGELQLVRPVNGALRTCGYVYPSTNEKGDTRDIYGDEIGIEYEVV